MAERKVVSDTADVIAAFGKALPTVRNNTATDENKTVFDSSFPGISVTGPNLTKVTVTETSAPTNLPAGVSAAMAWDIVPYVGEDEYHDTAKVTLPIPTEWTGADVFGGVIENGKVVPIKENLELDEENNTLTFTVPHFSTVMVLEAEKTVDIKLTIGEKKTESHPGNVTLLMRLGWTRTLQLSVLSIRRRKREQTMLRSTTWAVRMRRRRVFVSVMEQTGLL
ncbi:MAG: hypothetical protein ACLRR6_04230 [Oscillospiraceae bacterium]